ncbi:PTS glucose transporter subunit IIA [Alteromonas gilva]|uniref:PTS system glucose-specific EIIA component n=1 Tax=Alteromonas gilva TaxID=2987522 RepID=A0ABT5L4Z4_9ALTE|nr:PTS glucose transporter subunit IIA [Alteromonas gilva]MDC8831489.1 PTS glucose transporter subunit IIA [Alteromonas gilva]
MRLIAPATGDITPLHTLTHPLCCNGLLGDGVAIIMNRGDVLAPLDCVVEKVDVAKAQLRLVSTKGLKILLQLGEPGAIVLGERLRFNVKVGQRCQAGTIVAHCDPLWIKLNGGVPACIITLLNTGKLSALQIIPGSSVRAGEAGFLTLFA